MGWPTTDDLELAFKAAARAHHDYESKYLSGVRDEQWAGWYAAYTLGRIGDFTSPTELTIMLREGPAGENWARSAAANNPNTS